MKQFVVFVFLVSFCQVLCSQNLYFGYPNENDPLQSGDKIITNIPVFIDHRFLQGRGIEALANFLGKDSTMHYCIEIHYSMGHEDWALAYSEYIGKFLGWYISFYYNLHNFTMTGCGKNHPIFSDEYSEKRFNTRLEIIVE
ncbi:MAG: hypothetical protein J5862_03280 [Bacteroidales bacterium]|nr:hypothetical protein [Bacteroidales bacterium]